VVVELDAGDRDVHELQPLGGLSWTKAVTIRAGASLKYYDEPQPPLGIEVAAIEPLATSARVNRPVIGLATVARIAST